MNEIVCLRERMMQVKSSLDIETLSLRVSEIEEMMSKPGFWDIHITASELSSERNSIKRTLDRVCLVESLLSDMEDAVLLSEEDERFAKVSDELSENISFELNKLEEYLWFSGKFDSGDAILTINPGQGGLEAQDWSEMLLRMYTRYIERKGWKGTLIDVVPGKTIGIDSATLRIDGKNAYGMLHGENGIHRLVRISPTDAKERRQTTFASVAVMPVLNDDVEICLDPDDVRTDVFHSSGHGGQGVNTTDSAVRLTHIPTGIVVSCQDSRSQIKNKAAAFTVLKSRLYKLAEEKKNAELISIRGEKKSNSFGNQIRNYILYPYQLVKDVRTGIECSDVDSVLDGDIEKFIIAFIQQSVRQ